MLFAGVCRLCDRLVIALMLFTTASFVNWAATLDEERRANVAVTAVLKLKRILADMFV
jgi:hypothetical protein